MVKPSSYGKFGPCVDGSIGYFMDVYGDLPSDGDFPELTSPVRRIGFG